MKVYGYPGERVDFVSKSGAAGAIFFGDTRSQCEEFFGAPHTETEHSISYFLGALTIDFHDGAVAAVRITPGASREKVDVYLRREKLTGLPRAKALPLIAEEPVELEFAPGLEGHLQAVSFTG